MKSMSLQAYSRDPLMWGLEREEVRAKEQQPITYHGVSLPGVVPKQGNNNIIFEVKIHWWTGQVACFADHMDSLNNVAFYEDCVKVKTRPQSTDAYVREVFVFLRRGHSLLDPMCTCQHGLSMERARELGVPPDPPRQRQWCPVERTPTRRSLYEIERELHIECLQTKVQAGDKLTLLETLIQMAEMSLTTIAPNAFVLNMKMDKKKWFLHSPLCCILPEIATANDIIHAARLLAPSPFCMDEKQMGMFGVLLETKYRSDVLVLYKKLVFWQTCPKHTGVDSDIQTMWQNQKLEPALQKRELLEKALHATGRLRPMQTLPARCCMRVSCDRDRVKRPKKKDNEKK